MGQNGTYATASDLLGAVDLKREDVELKLGGDKTQHVLVWELTGGEFQLFVESLSEQRQERRQKGRQVETSMVVEQTAHRAIVRLCWLTLKDADGVRLFPEEHDVARLPQRVLSQVYEVADRLSGITGGVEEAGKGSEATPSEPSSSKSRSRSATRASDTSSVN